MARPCDTPEACFNSRLREEATCRFLRSTSRRAGFNSRLREEATLLPHLRYVLRQRFNSRLREEATLRCIFALNRFPEFQLTPP